MHLGSILMRGQDPRKNAVSSVSANRAKVMFPKETRYAQVQKLDVPTHHQEIHLGLTLRMTMAKFHSGF